MTEREEITSVILKSMNCYNFQRLYLAPSLPFPHLPKWLSCRNILVKL